MRSREAVRFVLAIALAIVIGSALALLTSGCVRRHSSEACVRAFREELVACVNVSKTRQEYDACKERVEIQWNHPHD